MEELKANKLKQIREIKADKLVKKKTKYTGLKNMQLY